MDSEATGRSEAQLRADRIRLFRQEREHLEREGVLELAPEQRTRLDEHHEGLMKTLAAQYDIDTTDKESRLSWGMRIASLLAAIALCAAIVLFFNRYWGLLGVTGQVVVLALGPLVALAGAEFASRREKTLYYTGILCLIAFACVVANLSMLGQMFNMPPSHDALLVWSLFALLEAYHFGLRLPLVAGLVCLLCYLEGVALNWLGLYMVGPFDSTETVLAASVLLFACASLLPHRQFPEFEHVYRLTGLAACLLSLLILAAVPSLSLLPWSSKTVTLVYEIAGLVVSAGAIWLGIKRQWRGVVNIGAASFVLFLYIRLARWWWDWMPRYLFFLIIGGIAIASLAAFKRLRTRLRAKEEA